MSIPDSVIPIVSNSKKISQLKARDTITYHQDHSWLAVSQYNDKICAYHNIAVNISSITGYAISKTSELSSYIIDERIEELVSSYGLSYISDFSYLGGDYDYNNISYLIAPNMVSYNLVSYTTEYTTNTLLWDYFPNKDYNNVKIQYILCEDENYLLTDKGRKIRLD